MGPSREGLTRDVVVCDAGPLIHLDEVGCLDLLSDFQTLYVPRQVWIEVERHRPAALASSLALQKVPIEISGAFSLDLGEQAALSLMESYRIQSFLWMTRRPAWPRKPSAIPLLGPWASCCGPSGAGWLRGRTSCPFSEVSPSARPFTSGRVSFRKFWTSWRERALDSPAAGARSPTP